MRKFHEKISDRMFDFKDFYAEMADSLPDNCVIAEVGLADGASSIFLAEALLNMGKKFKLHLIDSLAYGGPHQLNTIVNNVVQSGVAENGAVEILPLDSLNASCCFPDDHFDFVFIDASHRYEYTKADIRLWYRKIKHLGWLCGHDYNSEEGREVKQAAEEVIPNDMLMYEITAKHLGVWCVQRDPSRHLK